MANIFQLFGTIFIDNAEANKNIDTTTKKAETSGSKVGAAFSSIAKGAAALGTAVVTAAGTLGTAAYKMASDTTEAADEVDKMSQKLGLSREAYQEWDYVLSQAGVEITNMATGLKTLTNKLDDAKNSAEQNTKKQIAYAEAVDLAQSNLNQLKKQQDELNKKVEAGKIDKKSDEYKNLAKKVDQAEKSLEKAKNTQSDFLSKLEESSGAIALFEQLGLSINDLNSMSREDVFNAVIKGMQGMEDSTERAALANDLFGKSGQELTALFNETAESTEKLKQRAHELGMVMSDETVESGVQLHDSIDTIKRSFEGLKNSLGGAVIPIVQTFTDMIIGAVPKIQTLVSNLTPVVVSLFGELMPPLFDFIGTVFPMLLSFIQQLLPVLQGILTSLLPVIISLLQSLMPLFASIVEQVLPLILDLIIQIVPIVTQIIQTILPVFIQLIEKLLPYVLQIVQKLLPAIISLINTLLPPILQIINQILPVLLDLIDTVLPLVIQIIDAVLPVLINLIKTILPPILDIVNTILPILLDLIKLILPLVTNIIQFVLPILIEFLNMIAPILTPILDILVKVTNAFKSMIDFVKNVFTGNWKGAWESVKNVFANVWDSIKSGIKLPINAVIDGINALIRGLNKISFNIPDWVPGLGGEKFGIDIPEIKKLRVGMEYVPYDDFPALLHRGEKVLTASEAEESRKQEKEEKPGKAKSDVYLTLDLHIDKFNNNTDKDLDSLAEELMTLLNEKIKEKGAVFA